MFENMTEQQAKDQILEMVDTYCQKYHNQQKRIPRYLAKFFSN